MKPFWLISSISAVAAAAIIGGVIIINKINRSPNPQSVSTNNSFETPTGVSSPSSSSGGSSRQESVNVAGEYWCRSYNYNGAGGSCQSQQRLILNNDGSYSFGTTTGKYTYSGGKITFSGGLASRGPAAYTTDKEIRWEFTQNNAPYTITYYLRSNVSS